MSNEWDGDTPGLIHKSPADSHCRVQYSYNNDALIVPGNLVNLRFLVKKRRHIAAQPSKHGPKRRKELIHSRQKGTWQSYIPCIGRTQQRLFEAEYCLKTHSLGLI